MLELERTYLAKSIPDNLLSCDSKKIIDLYIENGGDHPNLRARQNGQKFEITRKVPVAEGDASRQNETTIVLVEEEFVSLLTSKNRKTEKTRYCYKYQNLYAEVDVFEGELQGLVVVDFEFDSEDQKNAFNIPDFCLAEVTQELFIAGGMLAGKTYTDIEVELQRFGYKKLFL
jgi:CYTH domain-containing protein